MPAGARSSPSGSPAPAHAVTSPAGTREHLTRDESRASAAGRPPASQPEPRQPDASQPEPSQPAASQPEPSQPAASQPEPSQPDASKREPSQPDASQPEPSQPHASQPQPSKREPSQPDAGRPDALRLTAPAGPAQATADSQIAGKATADGKLLYRRLTPVVMWWAWLAFAVFCLVDVVIPAHSYLSIEVVAGLLAITAAVYACTLRPRVIADDESVVIHNPFREHRVGWGAVRGVFLGDSVEFTCARPAPKKDKTIYCWALYGGRRPFPAQDGAQCPHLRRERSPAAERPRSADGGRAGPPLQGRAGARRA